MFLIIEVFLAVLAVTGLISIFIMLYDAESWLSKKFRGRKETPADEILAEYEALENHKSGEDGAQDFNS
jgi:flagellar basal body-associated protein FliL